MFQKDAFRHYFINDVGASANTMNTYNSFLNRIDLATGGLDEAIDQQGGEKLMEWATHTDKEPFSTYRSHARSVLKRYLQFRLEKASVTTEENDDVELDEGIQSDANFKVEKEMQAQVRQQIGQIEAGLVIADGGQETAVATGRIDILARDASGKLVVIELKAGKCPAGALEQVLAYAHSLSMERQEEVRAVLIAGHFTDRIRAAAKRANDVELKAYSYSLSFTSPD